MEILVIGSSARAAVHSALRAGLIPRAIDLFADADLRAVAQARRIDSSRYPRGLMDLAGELPAGPWLYTGAIENHPALVASLCRRRPLWGNPARVLRRVRDPFAVRDSLVQGGFAAAEVVGEWSRVPRDGTWLLKHQRSGGGHRIWPLVPGVQVAAGRVFAQRLIPGQAMSSVYLGDGRAARLAGVCRQLIGRAGQPYCFRGCMGPWPVEASAQRELARLGDWLASGFGLTGVFGVDFVWDGEQVWAIEVNPRYTASVEVLELALERPLLEWVREYYGSGGREALPAPDTFSGGVGRVVGKEILYARSALRWSEPVALEPFEMYRVPHLSDIPVTGSWIEAGQPVASVLVEGRDAAACASRLAAAVNRWEGRLDAMAGAAGKTRENGPFTG